MSYYPLSTTPLQGAGHTSGGSTLSSVPQSVQTWIGCFNANVPADAINKTEAAYVCTAVDVLDGGRIEGFKRRDFNTSAGGKRAGLCSGVLLTGALSSLLLAFLIVEIAGLT
jgi:hypothetical protein